MRNDQVFFRSVLEASSTLGGGFVKIWKILFSASLVRRQKRQKMNTEFPASHMKSTLKTSLNSQEMSQSYKPDGQGRVNYAMSIGRA